VVTTPVTTGAPSSVNTFRPVAKEQLTSIHETPQPRRRPMISLCEEPVDQSVNLSTATVASSVGRLDLGQYQQRWSSYVAQPSHVAPPRYEHLS